MPEPKKRTRPTPSKPYHHGDLRAALIESAVRLLREQGPDALTLRGVARAAGVSQAAPYRHFSDRRALVGAVAEEGFRLLGQHMAEAMRQAQGRPGMKGVARAYVRFAHEHPAEYRIMFGPEMARTDDLPSLHETSSSVLGFVKGAIEQLQGAGLVGPGDPGTIAITIWSMLHGLVMLSLDGQTADVGLGVDALVEEMTRLMMFGMAPRPAMPPAGAPATPSG